MNIIEKQTVAISYNLAKTSINNFLKLLDINPEAYEHLFKIPIQVKNMEEKVIAKYEPQEGNIYINETYIQNFLKKYSLSNSAKRIQLNIALSIVHELLHLNRSIMIEGGKVTSPFEEQENNRKEHNLDEYRKALVDVLKKPYANEFGKFIPIKSRINKDGTISVIAYNNETKNYNEFLNLDLKLNITDIDKYILELSEILNTKAFDSNVIKDNFVGDTDIAVVSDISFYDKEKTKKQELLNIHEKLENSDGLEEAFTEVLANIIIMSRNDVTLDLGKYLEKIEQAPLDVVGIDEKKAAKLIKYAGKDILKWFMLSTYGDYYDDEFENIFGSDYLRVLKDFQKLYDAVINEETGYEMFARDLDCIIEDKMGKKK